MRFSPVSLTSVRLVLLLPALAHAQGIGSSDSPPNYQAPLYLFADQCVQGAIVYGIGFYSIRCSDLEKLAPCLCVTTGQNPSSLAARDMSVTASVSCTGGGQGAAEAASATSAFAQFCSLNGAGGETMRVGSGASVTDSGGSGPGTGISCSPPACFRAMQAAG